MKKKWTPCEAVAKRGCRFVYVPVEGDYESQYADLKDSVEAALPESFKLAGALKEDAVVVGYNGHFEVCLTESDGATVIAVMVREDAPAFAKSRLPYTATAIFKKIAANYKLLVHNGQRFVAWKGEA